MWGPTRSDLPDTGQTRSGSRSDTRSDLGQFEGLIFNAYFVILLLTCVSDLRSDTMSIPQTSVKTQVWLRFEQGWPSLLKFTNLWTTQHTTQKSSFFWLSLVQRWLGKKERKKKISGDHNRAERRGIVISTVLARIFRESLALDETVITFEKIISVFFSVCA
jgi:hypothetical protein